MAEDKITLTPEQEKIILDAFQGKDNKNLPSITDLVHLAFPQCSDADGRSKWGRAIKALLIAKGLSAVTKTEYNPVAKVELTEVQKEFIRNNQEGMSVVEMAKILFGNQQLTNLNIEPRVIAEYVRTLAPGDPSAGEDIPVEDYRPPKTVPGVLIRVDKYIFNHDINKEAMTAQHKAGLEALLSYLNTFRFINQINLYESQTSRDLFESSFVCYTYDKPDLTAEEVDQYINVSHDNVAMAATQTRMERLSSMLDGNTSQNPDDRARISMGLVEAIGNLSTELNQVAKRQQSLLGDLKEKRSDRIAQLRSGNASILNLVQLWKEEKTRLKLLHLADARRKVVEKAANELGGMEEVKARIMGIDIDFLIHG